MSKIDPDEARRFLSLVEPSLRKLLGEDAWRELQKLIDDPALAMRAPGTFLRDAAKLGGGAGGTAPDFSNLSLENLSELMRVAAELTSSREQKDRELIARQPGATHLAELARDHSPSDELSRIFRETDVSGDITHLIRPGTTLYELIWPTGREVPFEERVGALASTLQHLSERCYQPLLLAALNLTKEIGRRPFVHGDEVGKTVADARQYWEHHHPELLPLASEPLRIIRNAEAHRTTSFDYDKETVTFMNTTRSGDVQTVGPLDAGGVSVVVRDAVGLVQALDAVHRRFHSSKSQ